MADEKAKEKIEPNCTSESVEKDILLSNDNGKEIDNEKPGTNKAKLKRRSSQARSIRQSLSATGLNDVTFEQQLRASLNNNSTVEEKLQKIFTLAHSATIQTLKQENKQLELGKLESEDLKADVVDHLVEEIGRKYPINAPLIDNCKQKLSICKKESVKKGVNAEENKIPTAQSSRQRTLKQYQDSLTMELNDWDKLLEQRKNNWNSARLDCNMVLKGEKKITDSHSNQLPRLEEAWLRELSDGSAEMDRLKKQETRQKLCKDNVHKRIAQKGKSLNDKHIELTHIAKKFSNYAAEKSQYKKSDDDTQVITKICNETIQWLDTNTFPDKLKEIEGVCNPIVTNQYTQASGVPEGMLGGIQRGMPDEILNGSEIEG